MKKYIAIILFIAIVSLIVAFFAFGNDVPPPDVASINYAVRTATETGETVDYIYMLTTQLTQAFNDMNAERHRREGAMQLFLYIFICVFSFASVVFCLYLNRRILKPFRKLQYFAGAVAAGNLDLPLKMDESNLFGAFTESFDLLREELKATKEAELQASQSKKELVASLSHDIKTPLASIKSSMELLLVKSKNEDEQEIFGSINGKVEQIDDLVTNLFLATLEELQALTVIPAEILSIELSKLIQSADYNGKVRPFSLPGCVIFADQQRLQQVLDNIISNAYKYANTNININSFIDNEYLVIDIQDYGAGVPDEELPLLTGKFYRGKNTEKCMGYGLGLYISKYFMQKMAGELACKNHECGFTVRLTLKLA
ncbi:MAG: HAMP domain-containing histidine kinase [Defluviitaleaceae bacterium]|nr:HAMP domain-containing histidine kinase [Defluviitaleaceae bacterium]